MKYINKNTGDSISESVYIQLEQCAKRNFIASSDDVRLTKQIIETNSNQSSVGDAILGVAILPIAIVAAIFS